MKKLTQIRKYLSFLGTRRKRSNRFVAIANVYRSERNWHQAAIHYQKALELAPDRRPIWVQLGHALKEDGKLSDAMQAYRRASALPGDDGDAPLHEGVLAADMGHISAAIPPLVQALDEKPNHPDAIKKIRDIIPEDFDEDFYTNTYRDVNESGLHPLVHYITVGRKERRAPNARKAASKEPARHVVFKEAVFKTGDDVAVLVTHVPSGRLKPHVLPYMDQLHAAGLSVLLVAVVDRPVELMPEECAAADGIIVRDNSGYDFGAWADALRIYPDLFGANLLVLTNDSVVPTADTEIFGSMIERVRKSPADVVGLTSSHEYGWHIQTYFIGLKPQALSSWGFQHFIGDIQKIDDKDEVIRTYEVSFGQHMRSLGLAVEAVFSSSFSVNPSIFSWKELIEKGFPFIKVLMLRKSFQKEIEHRAFVKQLNKEWPQVLEKAGFDTDLVRKAIFAAETYPPAGPDKSLLVNGPQNRIITNDHPLRIAYFGPWNYEGSQGQASRDLLCALRRTGLPVNAYPIVKPFHSHKQLCPAIETLDFTGKPDIAIVHLNPDSWDLLTDEQNKVLGLAKQRIGYWVWQDDQLPQTWEQKFHSVDRLWAPSAFCADVLAAETKLPVDVIPGSVCIPLQRTKDHEAILRKFRIDPESRIILSFFDDARDLLPQNPAALLNAFEASGLAQTGWRLVLCIKSGDRKTETAKILSALVSKIAGAQMLAASLNAEEMTALLSAADIYASPHGSNDFAHVIAASIRMGKPTVSIDYGNIDSLVESSCLHPVQTQIPSPGTVHEYLKADEASLTKALTMAAMTVTDAKNTKASNNKEEITPPFSYEAVTHAIMESFSALIKAQMPSAWHEPVKRIPPPPEVHVDLSSAQKFDQLLPADGVIPVPLAADLSWEKRDLPEGRPDDWLFFAPHNAYVAPDAVETLLHTAMRRPDVALFYADDVAAEEDMLDRIRLKPDFDRTLFMAQDYIGAPVFVRRKDFAEIGGLNPARGSATLYDMVLRMADSGKAISRITHVLLGYKGKRPVADTQIRQSILSGYYAANGTEFIPGATPDLLMQTRDFTKQGYPAVSLVIPTRRTCMSASSKTYIESLLEAIAKTAWPMDKLTVIVGDDIAGEADWTKRPWPFGFRRIETLRPSDEGYNYAAKMNTLWQLSEDEHIVLLNDDAWPTTPDWLKHLISFSCDNSVGGIGARLYYEDGSIQHVGMFPAFRNVAHAWINWPADARTYQNWAIAQREWSMVTGAVFATRRKVLEQLSGFDERFSLEFNDSDLCLRMRNLGYRVVYNPAVQFIHAEKASRGNALPPGAEVALFLSRWSRWLDHDPASHPDFTKNRADLTAMPEIGAWYLAKPV